MENRQITLKTVWSTPLCETIHGSGPNRDGRTNPCLSGDYLFATVWSPANVLCVSKADGTILWQRELPKYLGHPILVDEMLLVKHSHTLSALSPKDGNRIWKFCPYGEKSEWFYSYPVVRDGKVFLGDNKGFFNCLDLYTGEWLWRVSGMGRRSIHAPLALGEVTCFTTIEKFVSAHDSESGRFLWRQPLDSHHKSMHYIDSSVLVQTENKLLSFDPRGGGLLRNLAWPGQSIECVLYVEPHIYLILQDEESDEEGRLVCLHDYQEAWSIPASLYTRELQWNSELQLIYEIRIGGFSIVDPVLRQRLGDYVLPDSRNMGPPCYESGLLYFVSDDGELCSVEHPTT